MAQKIDWALYAQLASGVLGWAPDVFWQATPADFFCALAGWRRARGLPVDGDASLSPTELEKLLQAFPDA